MYLEALRVSAGRGLGERQIPARGCSESSLVKKRRLCLYPGHGGFRWTGGGDGAKFEHLLCPVDDLYLQLVGRGHS